MIDIDCTRGDSAEWSVTYAKSGVLVDLTGASMTMTGRRGPGGTVIFERTVGNGITIDPDQIANTGRAIVKLAPESTSGLAAEEVTLFYDVEVVLLNGDVATVTKGNLVVTPDASS